jgi:N-acetylmuramoyl-L-alanine amidase
LKARYPNPMSYFGIALILISLVSSSHAGARSKIVLDSGHQPSTGPEGGATGVCGQKEYVYNDQVVEALAQALRAEDVILTRKKGETLVAENPLPEWKANPSLFVRAAMANQQKADFFLSIHHDSVSGLHLIQDKKECSGKGGLKLDPAFRKKYQFGYNIFVNRNAPKTVFAQSIRFATLLANALKKMGRVPSTYHVFPDDDCKSCVAIDSKLGIWSQDLAVLRTIQMPGVLLEVGVIVDSDDEKKVNSDAFRKKMAQAVSKAFKIYFRSP